LYKNDSDAVVLEKMEDCRHPELNSITPETLTQLIKSENNYLVIDCRFGYEFQGGHIKGALNFQDPETLE
jgi:M-phase inducer tyrosine phosphatase